MQLKEQANKITHQLQLLVNFANKYEFPEGIAEASVGPENTIVILSVGYSEADRINVLVLAGDQLGRTQWSKRPDWNKDYFNWTKVVEGVKVVINKAETIPINNDAMPVHPTEFPLQLVDSPAEVSVNF